MENQRAHINAVRAHLAEIGLVASAGIDGMRSLLAIVREADEGGELPAPMRQALQALTARSTAGPDRPNSSAAFTRSTVRVRRASASKKSLAWA